MTADTHTLLARPSRRGVLLAGAAGAAAALAACTVDEPFERSQATRKIQATATTLPEPGAAPLGEGTFELFSEADLNFQTLFALGSAGQITVAGEVLSVVAAANSVSGGATYQSVFDGFVAMGNMVQEQAAASSSKGHLVTARSQFLRASKYYAQALYWVPGTSTPGAEAETYSAMDRCFRAAVALFETPPIYSEVNYGGTQPMPVWFFPGGSTSERRPTIIINNGSDGQTVDLLAEGGLDGLERGYNVVIFEGPGQGSQLFLHNIVFIPEWEKVLTPLIDELVKRRDVDSKKIAVRGISFGGLLTPRAAAFEPRIAALIADPGSTSTFLDYPEIVRMTSEGTPEEVNSKWKDMIIAGSTPAQKFGLKKSLEIFTKEAHDQVKLGEVPTDWYALSTEIKKFNLAGVAEKITCPTLVTMYEGDASFGEEPKKLYEMLTGVKDKAFHEFTAVNGTQYHCGPMSPQVSNEVCWDWVTETFAR